jgi:hypothetical protein
MDLPSTNKFCANDIANGSQGTSSSLNKEMRQTISELVPDFSTQIAFKPMGTSKPLKRKIFFQSDNEFITLKSRKKLLELQSLEEDLAKKARQRREEKQEELIQEHIQFSKQ